MAFKEIPVDKIAAFEYADTVNVFIKHKDGWRSLTSHPLLRKVADSL